MTKKTLMRSLAGVAVVAASALFMAFSSGRDSERKLPIYLNTNYSFEERAVDLVSRLTLEEKQSLLGNNMAAVPRLGIKQYNVWSEALHGVLGGALPQVGIQGPTSFPGSVALGSAWDPDLATLEASVIADEARAIFNTGSKGLTFWCPVIEPIRDPRWGRTGESFGEDPYLIDVIGNAYIRGFMGNDPKYIKAVPTGKHYFANNSEFDRHVSSSNMDARDMREFYLLPYKALIEKGNLPSIMSSYNAVNGVPTSASKFYLDTIARRTYGMEGYITGDCQAINDIWTGHYYKNTSEEATAAGLIAGVDSDCGSDYQRSMISALNQGLMSINDVDRALVNMFKVRMRTGEFDPTSMVDYSKYQTNVVNSVANQELAMEVATRTAVLLKNNDQRLPLKASQIKKIALIGPQANDVELGPYSGRPEATSMISPYQGITQYIKDNNLDIEVTMAEGANSKSKSNILYIGHFIVTKKDGTKIKRDATVWDACSEGVTHGSGMGTEEQVRSIDDGSWTMYNNVDLNKIDSLTVSINIPTEGGIVEARVDGPDGRLIATIEATKASGMRVGGVYGATTPVTVSANDLGFEGDETLYLCYRAPQDAEIDEATLAIARDADVAIVFVGTDENTATEEADRLTLLLPGNQPDLIKAVAAVNPNTVLVMQTLGCVEVDEFKDLPSIKSILWTGYNGQAQGAAIPKVLFGDVTPGGKLNATWYKSVKELPAITDYTLRGGNGKNGRTLWYYENEPSYEFGYGISYTTFEYSNISIDKKAITPMDKVVITADVTNTGNYDGDEVVQVYVRTPDSPKALQRPIKRLKGFQRVTIPVGATKTVEIEIDAKDLWFWDMENDRMTWDMGKYIFEVGSSSKNIKASLEATMSGKFIPEIKTLISECGVSVMRPGQTAQTTFSLAMTDDSFYDVTKAAVKYISSNPNVATVSESGLVTAKGMGVASITVKATVNGKTLSDTYAVKVMPNMSLASLTVDGKSVLKSGVAQYSIAKKAGSKVPVVAAKAADPAISVDVKQAEAVPGTAIVTITDYVTLDSQEILVNFGSAPVSDEFKNSLGKQWTVLREDKSLYNVANDALNLTSAAGDIANASNNAGNLILQSANCDWTIDTKIKCAGNPAMPAQNAGLLAYQDDDNFVKLVYAANVGRGFNAAAPAPGQVQLIAEVAGTQKAAANFNVRDIIGADNVLYLRLVKRADSYTAYCSVDGKKFEKIGTVGVGLKDIKAGLIDVDGVQAMRFAAPGGAAPAPTVKPFKVAVDYFRVSK